MAAIELRGLGRAYGDRVVLRDLTLTLAERQTLAVFGPNGAGKTTLLRILAGLLRPHAGTASVAGRVGLLAHEPLLYRDLSVRQNLEFHARLHRVAPDRVQALLEAVGLDGRAEEPLRLLSQGMVQRAAVCRAVLHEPDVLLLDEPFANLDPGATKLIAPLLAGGTRVLISHDVEAGLAAADVVLGLRDGRAAFVAPAGEVEPERVRRLYG